MKAKAWKIAVAALAITGGASQVQAGDYKGGYATVDNWAGYYAGAALGFARAGTDTTIHNPMGFGPTDVSMSTSDTSLMGGFLAGYNWQNGNQVYGIEGEISFPSNYDYMASVRGRYGIIHNNWLYYGTAGVTFIESASASIPQFGVNVDTSSLGFVLGGGAETKINSHVTAGVEGLYNILAEETATAGSLSAKTSVDVFTIRARLTYKFD